MSSKIKPSRYAAADDNDDQTFAKASDLPVKEIPGSCGVPFVTPVRDRLDFYYFQGKDKFFLSRIEKYGSTVFRVNMPPGPFMASDPRVICLLDAKSFPTLFDMTKVEKRDVLTGTYVPSTSLTGGYRVCAYLDPSEPHHTMIKQLLFRLLTSRKSALIPSFQSAYSSLFDDMESEISKSKSSDFGALNDKHAFDFVGDAFFGAKPSEVIGPNGPTKAALWLFVQLCPLIGLMKLLFPIEDLLLHTFPIPPWLVKSNYKALHNYVGSAAAHLLDDPLMLGGLSRDEALHNLVFATFFNAYGGIKFFYPALLARVAQAGPALHDKLAREIRSVVKSEGGKLTFSALEKLELTKSAVYEALRIDPPIKFQYGRAKRDLIVESHDAAFKVKKGEMLFGYQPIATRDPKVFEKPEDFIADRFVGDKGKELLKYVLWSNGPETESPSVSNKQCAGKDFVVTIGRLLLALFFLRYDTVAADIGTDLLGPKVTVKSLTKATSASAGLW